MHEKKRHSGQEFCQVENNCDAIQKMHRAWKKNQLETGNDNNQKRLNRKHIYTLAHDIVVLRSMGTQIFHS